MLHQSDIVCRSRSQVQCGLLSRCRYSSWRRRPRMHQISAEYIHYSAALRPAIHRGAAESETINHVCNHAKYRIIPARLKIVAIIPRELSLVTSLADPRGPTNPTIPPHRIRQCYYGMPSLPENSISYVRKRCLQAPEVTKSSAGSL